MNLKGVLYVASIILLQIIFLCKKKTDKKTKLLFGAIGISIVLIMCLNAFISYCLTFFDLKTSLTTLTIINLILSIIIGTLISKDRKKNSNFCYAKI